MVKTVPVSVTFGVAHCSTALTSGADWSAPLFRSRERGVFVVGEANDEWAGEEQGRVTFRGQASEEGIRAEC